ncbi:MFS transporter [Brevibacillus laterosporus]|uniref:MFS transporter n=1 Tax=Brevibacillus laterosporus TaxID=1465 RepID=UPI000E6C9222|nr:MFS transporter [Brevibacillus laterosporus]AYB38026.1 MFS transporter [Brevibacillus laterosporus]MBM7110613.1 Tetracycline resistance protein, class B [Brevibacillus laterosporus]MCR8937014.1 MFS transporter [Brevibacillus laterosporus]MCZ0839652.1 MFS transporter [Brevibacillus laterosporus]MCZ0844759.1 MFS transporter [Brevibacillus laterosporus]
MEPKRVIFLSLMICYIGLGVINPVLAPLIREIGLDEMHAGWIISASALVLLLSAPIWGHQSDRFGRKPIMIIGLIGFTFSLVLFAWLAWIGLQGKIELTFLFILLLLSRTLFGLFFPAMTSSGQALMADLTPLNERAAGMAMIGAASGIGFLIGPAMGAALAGIHLLFPIVVAAVLSLFAALLVYARIPRFTPKSSGERNKLNLRKPGIRPYLLIALCLMSALVMLQVTAGFYVQDKFGLNSKDTALWVGISLFCVGFMMALVQMAVIRKRSFMPRTLLRIGLPILGTGLLLLVSIDHLFGFVLSFLLLGVGGGFAIPGYTAGVSMASGEEEQGAAAGLTTAATGVGSFVAPIVGTALYRIQPEAPYWLAFFVIALLSMYVWSTHRGLDVQQIAIKNN